MTTEERLNKLETRVDCGRVGPSQLWALFQNK